MDALLRITAYLTKTKNTALQYAACQDGKQVPRLESWSKPNIEH